MKKNKIVSVAVFLLLMFSSIVVLHVKSYDYYGYLGEVIDSWEYDAEEAHIMSRYGVVRLGTSEYYATCAYGDTGSDQDGFLRTFRVYNNGTIDKSIISKWEYDTSDGAFANIINISGDVYAVLYWDSTDNHGTIFTTTIWSSNGTLKQDKIDQFDFSCETSCPFIVHVDGDIYAVIYQEYGGSDFDYFMETLEIDSNGIITDNHVDVEEFDSQSTQQLLYFGDATMIDNNTISIVYQENNGWDLWICTYNFTEGIIDDEPADTWEFDSSFESWEYAYPDIHPIYGNIFAITYSTSSADDEDLRVITINITDSGVITKLPADDHILYAGELFDGRTPIMYTADGNQNVYLISFRPYTAPSLITCTISNTGSISTYLDLITLPSMVNAYIPVVHLYKNNYLAIYEDGDDDGRMSTFEVEIHNLPPVLGAEAHNLTVINVTWQTPFDADTTYIEYMSEVEYDDVWGMGEGNFIYNDTGTQFMHDGLDEDTWYFYQGWSYNATENIFSECWSSSASTLAQIYIYEYPENESSGVEMPTICVIAVNSTLTDTFTITWQENSTGEWVTRQVNSSVVNGTYFWNFTQASETATKHYWRVWIDTGLVNHSYNYSFTTESIYYPVDEDYSTYIATMNTCIQQGRNCTLYAVYLHSGESGYYFHLASSSDNGTSWDTDTFLDEYYASSDETSFMIDGNGTMHFTWVAEYEEHYVLFYSRSFDNGVTWAVPSVLITSDDYSVATVTGCLDVYDNIHLFYGADLGMACIYHIVSFDGGSLWNNALPDLVNDTNITEFFTVASDFDDIDSYLYLVYNVYETEETSFIYITSSIDNGTSWSEPVYVNDTARSYHSYVHIAVDSLHTIHLAGSYEEDGDNYLFYTRSSNSGFTWDELVVLSTGSEVWVTVDAEDAVYIPFRRYNEYQDESYLYYFNSSDGGDSFYDSPVEHGLMTDVGVNDLNAFWSNYPVTCDVRTNVPATGLFLVFLSDDNSYIYATFTDDFGLNCGCFPEYVPPPQTWYPIDLVNESYVDLMGTSIQQGRNCTIYAVYFTLEEEDQYYFHLASSADGGASWTTHSFLEEYYTTWWAAMFLIDVNGTMHFAWISWSEIDGYELTYSRSYNNGVTWSEPVVLITLEETVGVDGYFDYYGNMHVFWSNFTSISHIVSYDAGNSWNNESFDVVYFGNIFPSFAGAADYDDGVSYIYILFYHGLAGAIYITRSVDNGASWSEPVLVDDISPEPMYFYIAVDGDHVLHFVDVEGIGEEYFVSYTRSFDHGATWDEIVNLVTVEMLGPFIGEYGWITTDCNDNIYIIFINDGVIYYYLSSDGGDGFYLEPDAQTISDEISGAYSFNAWWSNYPEADVCGDKMNIPATGLFIIFNEADTFYLYDAFSDDFSMNCCLGPTIPAPTSFTATTITCSRIDLSWTKASGATHTRIQRKTGSYPTSIVDGTNVYNGTGSSYSNMYLSENTTYYYSAWSWDNINDTWSELYATAYNVTSECDDDGGGGDDDDDTGGGTNPPTEPGTGWPLGFPWGMNLMLLIIVIILLVVFIGSLAGIKKYANRIRRCK